MTTSVAISKKGKALLKDKKLASKVVDAILENKTKFETGEAISVKGETFSVQLVTSTTAENSSGANPGK